MEEILKNLTASLLFFIGFNGLVGFAASPGTTDSPYGACAHLNRWEFPEMKQELRMMKEAGIGLDRTDLDWAQVEPDKGKWNFSRWDAVLDAAEQNGITILPILAGIQPKWGSPLTAHMDEWKNYITTVVNRYKGRIGIYEIFQITEDIGRLVFANESSGVIREAARRAGMRSLRDDAMRKAEAGISTLEEVIFVTLMDEN